MDIIRVVLSVTKDAAFVIMISILIYNIRKGGKDNWFKIGLIILLLLI